MASEQFGYKTKTKRIWVLKAQTEDAKDMSNLYRNISEEEVRVLRSLFIRGERFIAFLEGKEDRSNPNQLSNAEIGQCKKRWLKRIELNKDDYYKDVIYVIRDQCKKIIGILETLSDDGIKVEVQIWIPNNFKRAELLEDVVESLKEWLIEQEEYEEITKIMLGDAIGRETESLVENYKQA